MENKDAAFLPDPLLGSLIGLCPVVFASGNFASGTILAVGVFFSMVALGTLLPLIREYFPERLRAPLSFAMASAFAALYYVGIDAYSSLLASLVGIFLPLIAVNCAVLTTLRRGLRNEENFTSWTLPSASLYLVVVILFSAFREIIGAGRITLPLPGENIRSIIFFPSPPLRLLVAPAGGFMLLGAFACLYRFVQSRTGRRIL